MNYHTIRHNNVELRQSVARIARNTRLRLLAAFIACAGLGVAVGYDIGTDSCPRSAPAERTTSELEDVTQVVNNG